MPLQEGKQEDQSDYIPSAEVFQVTPELIEKYVEENNKVFKSADVFIIRCRDFLSE